MTEHLSEKQIARCLADNARAPETAHLAQCPACALAVSETRQALTAFRSTVVNWTEDQQHRPAPSKRATGKRVYALALALTLAFAFFAASLHYRTAHPPPAASDDELLLHQVNAAVAQSIPTRLEPLQLLTLQLLTETNPGQ